jgi:1,4-dihydroxy-2-naphthoate octaprenyltransferase
VTKASLTRVRAWVLASRPRTLTAAAAPVLLGTGLATGRGAFSALPALAALSGALLIQIGTNLANDYYDHLRGGDTEDRVGPVRVTQAGLIPPSTVRKATYLVLGAAFLLGGYLVWVGGWPIAVIGLASLVCAVAYTGGPFPLAYRGLGDLFVFLFFGLVAVGGTFWVQAFSFGPEVLLAGAGMGAMNTAILVVNNLRDLETDARAGKHTLAVRLGHAGTKFELLFLVVMGYGAPLVGMAFYGWPGWVLLSFASALPLLTPLRTVRSYLPGDDPRILIPTLGGIAQAAGLYGFLLGVALAMRFPDTLLG